jgi:CheY-like chemotaxis protein
MQDTTAVCLSAPRAPVVLVADDNPGILQLIAAIFQSQGESCELVQAADGDEAWRMILDRRPAVAVLDWRMPGQTGPEIASAIKAAPELAATTVVLLTGNCGSEEVRYGYAAGADRVIGKPFSPLELLTAVNQALVSHAA